MASGMRLIRWAKSDMLLERGVADMASEVIGSVTTCGHVRDVSWDRDTGKVWVSYQNWGKNWWLCDSRAYTMEAAFAIAKALVFKPGY